MAGREGTRLISPLVSFAEAAAETWTQIWPIFREVVKRGDTYAYPPDIDEETARSTWMPGGPGEATFVALVDGAVVATAILRPNQPGLGDHVANAGWMVAPSRQGQGVGRLFADYVLQEARRRGFAAMQFNSVVASNTAAIGLWKSLGFEIVGTIPDAFRHAELGPTDIHVMHRQL